jgi:superfamily I DNA and/or RNA helicase
MYVARIRFQVPIRRKEHFVFATQNKTHTHTHTKVGVITPYTEQRRELERCFAASNDDVEINTIDGFQGREKDIIIISCVRAEV